MRWSDNSWAGDNSYGGFTSLSPKGSYTWGDTAGLKSSPNAWSGNIDLGKSAGTQGGGMAFPFMAAATLGSSLIGGLFGNSAANTQARIANAQLQAAGDQLKWSTLENRQARYGQLAGDIGARVGGETARDLDFDRQRAAAMFQAGPLAERNIALNMQEGRQRLGLEGSAEARDFAQRQRRAELGRTLAERQAAMAGMFGPISQAPGQFTV